MSSRFFPHLPQPRHREPRMSRTDVLRKRTGGRCGFCGVRLAPHQMTRDHIVPKSKGGETRTENLLCCCAPCNQRKADLDLEDYRQLYFGGGPFYYELRDGGLV